MSYDLIDRKDQRIDTIFKGLENMERMIDAIRTAPRPAFHSDYFLTAGVPCRNTGPSA